MRIAAVVARAGRVLAWEPADRIGWPVWRYPPEERAAPAHAYDPVRHGRLRAAITAELARLT